MIASCSGVSNVMFFSERSGDMRQFLGCRPGVIHPCFLTHGSNTSSGPSSSVDPASRVTPLTVMSLGQHLKFQFMRPFANARVEGGGLVHLHLDRR